MQQAAATNPEAIISMYGQSGCVALMRARVELQVEVPAFTNTACLADTVINAVGDAAQGWYFAGSQGGVESADTDLMRQYVGKVVNKAPEDVDVFGFTTLGWIQTLSIWKVAKISDRRSQDRQSLIRSDKEREPCGVRMQNCNVDQSLRCRPFALLPYHSLSIPRMAPNQPSEAKISPPSMS